jgi:hypothetical protein
VIKIGLVLIIVNLVAIGKFGHHILWRSKKISIAIKGGGHVSWFWKAFNKGFPKNMT